jgi:hypothetical protein
VSPRGTTNVPSRRTAATTHWAGTVRYGASFRAVASGLVPA